MGRIGVLVLVHEYVAAPCLPPGAHVPVVEEGRGEEVRHVDSRRSDTRYRAHEHEQLAPELLDLADDPNDVAARDTPVLGRAGELLVDLIVQLQVGNCCACGLSGGFHVDAKAAEANYAPYSPSRSSATSRRANLASSRSSSSTDVPTMASTA